MPDTFLTTSDSEERESSVRVRVRGLGKTYSGVARDSLVRRLASVGRAKAPDESRWIFRGLDFEVLRGEALGIIGENGSGKTTLLSIIAGATFPTEGEVGVRGKVSALLALGTGFENDMRVLEAVQLAAVIMGLTVREASAVTPDILRFAGLEDRGAMFVRHLSNGMRARLSFAIGVVHEPDVFLVDEVLAVGDESFQEKCREHINAMQQAGAAVIFIAHDMALVRQMCSRVAWLDGGSIRAIGATCDVVDEYVAAAGDRTRKRASMPAPKFVERNTKSEGGSST